MKTVNHALLRASLVSIVAVTPAARASQTRVETVQGAASILAGELEGASVDGDGVVTAGPDQRVVVDGLVGAVLAVARGGDGQLYVATAGPGRVVRVDGAGKAGARGGGNGAGHADIVWDADKPLVTALLTLGRDRLVALTAPDGGAEIFELATKKRTTVACKDAGLLLGGAVLGGDVWAVGGSDDGGVVVKLGAGEKEWVVVARTKQELRSIAVARQGSGVRVVAGSSDEGIVYDIVVDGKDARVRALLDAAPGEVTSVALAADGTVFAGLTDGEGKLSKQASSKAKDAAGDDDDDKKPSKKSKARKVKGGEIWRLGTDGSARLVFQSKEHGPYTLALDAAGRQVLAGTGPEGRIVALDVDGRGRPGVWTRRSGHDEITALLVEKSGVVAGASHGGAVLALGGGAFEKAAYLSPPLDAEGRARWGLVRVTTDALVGGRAPRVALRTGNTRDPDETWSDWSPAQTALVDGVVLQAPPAPYAQVKVELPEGARVSAVHVAALVDNRAPDVVSLDVLAPGWKVVATPREPPETRSVNFGEKPFARFLDRRGAQNPTLEERPYGKQSFDVGYRTAYAYVEDADKDALRYRFWLGAATTTTTTTTKTPAKTGGAAAPDVGDVGRWTLLQDWSEAPFVSFEASRLGDGDYRIKVEVDDSPTNGPARALADAVVSDRFVVSHVAPRFVDAVASRAKGGARLSMRVEAVLPLVSVRCSTQLSDWQPLDPKDGILDGRSESFDLVVSGGDGVTSVSCEAYDEALSFARIDVPVR